MPALQRQPAVVTQGRLCTEPWPSTCSGSDSGAPTHSAGSSIPHQTLRFKREIHRNPPILTRENGSGDGVLVGVKGSKSCPRPGRQQTWAVKLGSPRAHSCRVTLGE